MLDRRRHWLCEGVGVAPRRVGSFGERIPRVTTAGVLSTHKRHAHPRGSRYRPHEIVDAADGVSSACKRIAMAYTTFGESRCMPRTRGRVLVAANRIAAAARVPIYGAGARGRSA